MKKKLAILLLAAFAALFGAFAFSACGGGDPTTPDVNNNQSGGGNQQDKDDDTSSITFDDFIKNHSDKAKSFYTQNLSAISAGSQSLGQIVSIGANQNDELNTVTVARTYKSDGTKCIVDIVTVSISPAIDLDDIVDGTVENVQYTTQTTTVFEFDSDENLYNSDLAEVLYEKAGIESDLKIFSEHASSYGTAVREFRLLSFSDGVYTVEKISVFVDNKSKENLMQSLENPELCIFEEADSFKAVPDGSVAIISEDYTGQGDAKNLKTVSFVLGYETNNKIADMQFEVGQLMTRLPVPNRDDYTFLGWYNMNTKYTAESIMPNENLTLFARWEKKVSVYADDYVSLKPATEGYKDISFQMQYNNVDKYVYVELTSDDLGGAAKVGKENNFTLRTLDSMEYKVNPGYTWTWYQGSFSNLNGAQLFTLYYGSNVQLVTVSDSSGIVKSTYLVDLYVKHDYYLKLYSNIYEDEPFDTVRVIENETMPADVELATEDGFEFDSFLYMNTETLKYEKFVMTTQITKDYNLYQSYKAIKIEAELGGGTLDGDLEIVPYTTYFTLPSPEKTGFDFIGWQDPEGKFLTNVQGYSGAHYISKDNKPAKLTAVYEAKKNMYKFDGLDLKIYPDAVPVVIYSDSTMEEIFDIIYTPYGELCVLPEKVPEKEKKAFSGWQHYYVTSEGVIMRSLSAYEFDVPLTAPLALAPDFTDIDGTIIPINTAKTYTKSGTYKFYLPASDKYQLKVTTPTSVSFSVQAAGASSATNYTATSSSPITATVYCYKYNLGSQQYIPGEVILNVKTNAEFTVEIVGKTAVVEGKNESYGVYNIVDSGEKFTVTPQPYMDEVFDGWYKSNKRVSEDPDYQFSAGESIETYRARYNSVPNLEYYNYTKTDTTLVITGLKDTEITDLVLPQTATSIASDAFKSCKNIISVTIPENVTSIGSNAFYDCNKLVEVINLSQLGITKGSTGYGYVAYYAFSVVDSAQESKLKTTQEGYVFIESDGKTYLVSYIGNETDLQLPENYEGNDYEIIKYAIYDNDKITSITIPDSVTTIGTSAFSGCTNIKTATIPALAISYIPKDSLQTVVITSGDSIGGSAFKNCTSLENITIPDSITSIGSSAFEGCTSLESITIPDSVTSIGYWAFDGCTNIKSATIPTLAISYIPQNSLQTVVITSGDSIGGSAFSNCESLASITIPESVTSIGNSAFWGCTSLTGVYITDLKAWCNIDFGNSSANPLYYAHNLYLNNEPVTAITAEMLQGITEIKDYAFYNCTSLESITIGAGVTSIGSDAFYDCNKLVEVINLSQLGITKGSTDFGGVAQYALSVVDSAQESKLKTTQEGYVFFEADGKTYLVNYIGNETVLQLPENYEGNDYDINAYAFYNNNKITSVTIPDSVTSIGSYAFDGCTNIKSATIPTLAISYIPKNSLQTVVITSGNSIGESAFSGCKSLESITIPDGVTTIGSNAFRGCTSLESITIPDSVTSIGDYVFSGCTSLANITIPESVTSIGSRAFWGCTYLKSVTFGNISKLETIGELAFDDCTKLTNITIPGSVTSIGYGAFSGCTSLKNITIPDSVTSIGGWAFSGCTNLKEVTFKNTTGWKVSQNSNMSGVEEVDVTDNTSKNATLLKSTYCYYYWKRYDN